MPWNTKEPKNQVEMGKPQTMWNAIMPMSSGPMVATQMQPWMSMPFNMNNGQMGAASQMPWMSQPSNRNGGQRDNFMPKRK